jgi:hypothetical protein
LKPSTMLTAATLVVASLSIVAGKIPSAPRNVRIVSEAPPVPDPGPPPPPCVIPATAGGPHAYFDALVRRPEHLCNWSLRSQPQLDSLVGHKPSTNFTYAFKTDSYPDAQDAAKFYVPTGLPTASISTYQQLHMPLAKMTSGSIIIAWDWYWGPEFRANRGGMNHYKMFHVMIGGHAMWTLMQSPTWASGADEAAKAWDSLLAGPAEGTFPNGLLKREPYQPSGVGTPNQGNKSGSQYPQYHSRWMRYWIEIKLFQPHTAFTEWNAAYGVTLQPHPNDAQGRWHMVSLWSADETRDVQRLVYRVPVGWKSTWSPSISRFDFEMNTSQNTGFIGPWIGYGRNVVVLHDYRLPSVPETDAFLFQRPVR